MKQFAKRISALVLVFVLSLAALAPAASAAASLPALMEVVPSAAARAVWQHFHAAPEKTNEED